MGRLPPPRPTCPPNLRDHEPDPSIECPPNIVLHEPSGHPLLAAAVTILTTAAFIAPLMLTQYPDAFDDILDAASTLTPLQWLTAVSAVVSLVVSVVALLRGRGGNGKVRAKDGERNPKSSSMVKEARGEAPTGKPSIWGAGGGWSVPPPPPRQDVPNSGRRIPMPKCVPPEPRPKSKPRPKVETLMGYLCEHPCSDGCFCGRPAGSSNARRCDLHRKPNVEEVERLLKKNAPHYVAHREEERALERIRSDINRVVEEGCAKDKKTRELARRMESLGLAAARTGLSAEEMAKAFARLSEQGYAKGGIIKSKRVVMLGTDDGPEIVLPLDTDVKLYDSALLPTLPKIKGTTLLK